MSTPKPATFSQQVELTNLNRFDDIFEKCFGFMPPKGYFEWKYAQNPAGKLIAFEEINESTGEVGAFYGITPEEYLINGVPKLIYQSMDTMTHPNYRNRGLFIKLAKETYNHAYNVNKHLELIGIPGSNSYHGFVKKLEWKNPVDFQYIFQHRSIIKGLSLFSSKKIELEKITMFDSEIDLFFQNRVINKKIVKMYNKEVLNWKITQHPFNKYVSYKIRLNSELIGLVILQKEPENIKIVFIDFVDNKNRVLLKDVIRQIAAIHDFKFIYTWNSTDDEMAKQYKAAAFVKNPFSKGLFSYRVPLILLSKNDDLTFKSNWENSNNFEFQPIIQD